MQVTAYALELYNEDLLDLSMRSGRDEMASKNGWDTIRASLGLKLQERPVGKDGRVVPEVSDDTDKHTNAFTHMRMYNTHTPQTRHTQTHTRTCTYTHNTRANSS
jgi:kinesin family protein 4/21/27